MKSSLPFWFLSVTACLLLVANRYVRRERPAETDNRFAHQTEIVLETSGSTRPAGSTPIAGKKASAREGVAPKSATPPKLDWTTVETTDYKQYAANLRSLGFPEELVRAVVIADVNKHYQPREAPLRPKPVPFDAPVSQRQSRVTEEELLRMRQLRDVQIEKQQALKEILGVYVPRELLKTPTARNYIAYEYALNLVPPEKRDAAQLALENEWFADDVNKYLDRASYVEVYKRTREERNAALLAILTPEEFNRFEMNSNPAGTELARRTIGMEPTDKEFQALFTIAWDHWVETGGVGGLWRAERVPPEQIAAADSKMNARLEETLGADRYIDYRMATSDMGQQMRNLAARYDLPRETLARAFRLQAEADQLLKADVTELQQQIERILGPAIWQAWTDGRNRRVKLEP